MGKKFDKDFKPQLTPEAMLRLGVFEGKYLNDCRGEFPKEWYKHAKKKLSLTASPELNMFKIKSRLSLQEWRKRGWIPCCREDHDVRGWFQWYCRYWLGRRIESVDKIQIKRWRAFTRHVAQVIKNCKKGDRLCRPKQRQALLQWAYNPLI